MLTKTTISIRQTDEHANNAIPTSLHFGSDQALGSAGEGGVVSPVIDVSQRGIVGGLISTKTCSATYTNIPHLSFPTFPLSL
jgi:hypothetical protein